MSATVYAKFELEQEDTQNCFVDESGPLPNAICNLCIRDDEAIDDTYRSFDCTTLAEMLKQTRHRMKHVNIEHWRNTSPEYLALLASLFRKVDHLYLPQFAGDAAYACLRASLLHTDGPQNLQVYCVNGVSLHQSKLLFDGIACSPSLTILDLNGAFEHAEDASMALIDSLRRNKRLKRLELSMTMDLLDANFQEILGVAMTTVEELLLWQGREVEQSLLRDSLCRQECSLKKLTLSGVAPSRRQTTATESNELEESATNTSLTEYRMYGTQLDCSRIMETAGMFQSIETLYLSWNRITDLSPLDPLLLGDNKTLKTLVLKSNDIQEHHAIEFFRKLPDCKSLRFLNLASNPFVSNPNSWKAIAIDAVRRNKTLEYLDLTNAGIEDFGEKIWVPLSLNRGGRRALEMESSTPLPANLLPKVIERAMELTYCHDPTLDEDDFFGDAVSSTRVDVVFWLMREKVLGHCL